MELPKKVSESRYGMVERQGDDQDLTQSECTFVRLY